MVKLFITNKFGHLIKDSHTSRDLNADTKSVNSRSEGGNNVRLMINLGKKDRFDIQTLFSLINSNKNLKGIEIGKISLMPDHTIFSVDREYSPKVLKYLAGANFKGKKIDITVTTRRDSSFSRGRGRSAGGRARSKNRKNFKGNSGRSRNKSGSRGRW